MIEIFTMSLVVLVFIILTCIAVWGAVMSILYFRDLWITRKELIEREEVIYTISEMDMWCRADLPEMKLIAVYLRQRVEERDMESIDSFRERLRKFRKGESISEYSNIIKITGE